MTRCVGGSQQIAHLNRCITRIYLTVDLAKQSNRLPVASRLLLIEYNGRLVIAGTGNNPCHPFIMGTLTWEKRTVFPENHYRSWLDRFVTTNVEVLGTVG